MLLKLTVVLQITENIRRRSRREIEIVIELLHHK